MTEYFIVALAALISGVVQGSCGFGAGIILMIALPFYYPLSQAAGVSCIMNIALIAAMVYRYRRHINLRKVILPLLLYAAVASSSCWRCIISSSMGRITASGISGSVPRQ